MLITTILITFLIIVIITNCTFRILHENYTNEIANKAVEIINKRKNERDS